MMEIINWCSCWFGWYSIIVVAVIILALLVLLLGLPIKILYNGIVGAIILWILI
jgi:hypothetical protein